MKNILTKVPIPLCGVMLGLSALGNLLQSYSEGLRYLCGGIASFIMILILLKLILYPKTIAEDFSNPIMASVACTFPMALMLLSTYLKPFAQTAAFCVWIGAIFLHLYLIVFFTVKFMIKLQMPKVFASYFIVYVGIAVAAVTAPVYAQLLIGTAAFWFGFAAFIILFILITVRYSKWGDVPKPAQPLICIYAAPLSLCLAGYIQSVQVKSVLFILAMLIVSNAIYLFALWKAVGYLKEFKFYPSYASFTFPFVISAVAAKQSMVCLANMGHPIPALSYLVLFETIVAVVFVLYTFIRFMGAIFIDH